MRCGADGHLRQTPSVSSVLGGQIPTAQHSRQRHIVVGEQPELAPGETFEYTSACPLRTSMGTMHGSYTMETAEGERFDAEVAPFVLADPLSLN